MTELNEGHGAAETPACPCYEPLLSGFLLEEISESEREAVAAHLAVCRRCSGELALLRSTVQALAGSAPSPAELYPAQREALRRSAGSGGRSRRLFFTGVAAAAAAVVAMAILADRFRAPGDLNPGGRGEAASILMPMPEGGSGREGVEAWREEEEKVTLAKAPSQPAATLPEVASVVREKLSEERRLTVLPAQVMAGKADVNFQAPVAPATELVRADRYVRESKDGEASESIPGLLRSDAGAQGRARGETLYALDSGTQDPLRVPANREALQKWLFYGKPAEAPTRGFSLGLQEAERARKFLSLAEKPVTGGGLARSPATPAPVNPAPAAGVAQALPVDVKNRVDEFLSRLDRRSGETPAMMFYRYWGDNPFLESASEPRSTFGADVDTASYTLFRSHLEKQGVLPPREAIRTEEFLNYFHYAYDPPERARQGEQERAFAIHAEVAPSPFSHQEGYQLLRVGIQGRQVAEGKRKPCSLVFVVDTSGSMRMENRLELVKDGLRLLVEKLDEGDRIGIVAFDFEARTVLESSPASERERILDAIARLEPRRNTNVAAGLLMGYQMAAAHLLRGGSNRVLLLSDGVANTGTVDPQEMLSSVRTQRERGIFLTCVGVGMGNHNDALMEQLADRGDGQCLYVDRPEEARRVFGEKVTGTLEAIARNVKVQVEFEPARVIRYRLLGYENRALPTAAFRDNSTLAGLVGAGHAVTALYELKPKAGAEGRLAAIRLRYQTVEDGEAVEVEREVLSREARSSFADASPRFQLAACVGAVAEVLRESYWARSSTLERIAGTLESVLTRLGGDRDAEELLAMVKRAAPLIEERRRLDDPVARTIEAIKENNYRRVREAPLATSLPSSRPAPEPTRGSVGGAEPPVDALLREAQDLRRRLLEALEPPPAGGPR